jgi:hypothetical protein
MIAGFPALRIAAEPLMTGRERALQWGASISICVASVLFRCIGLRMDPVAGRRYGQGNFIVRLL